MTSDEVTHRDEGGGEQPLAATSQSGGVNVEGNVGSVGGDVVGRDKIVQQAPAVGVEALHQLPPPPRDFTGRKDELSELMAQAAGGGVTISGLHGMGGVGKTALALVLAERLKARYPDAQFYLDLKGADKDKQEPLTVADALKHVIRAYHPTAQLPESEAELRGLYQSVLYDQRALLLMDNAANAWQVQPLLPPASCFLLVTSRQHFAAPGLHAKNLDTLPPDDARDLLLKIVPRIGGHADEIARLCGYLPLALRLAGSALAERVTLTVEGYIQRLSNAQEQLKLIDASLSLSYDLLDQDLQRAWCALAVFPETFDLAAAAAVWDAEETKASDRLDILVRYSIVEWDATSARARLHDLARVFADARLEDEERTNAQRRHAQHFESMLREAKELYKQGGENILYGLALFDLERANIETGQVWANAKTETDDVAAQLCSDYPDAGVYVLDLRHHSRERIRWLEAALGAARRLKDKGAESVHLGNLGLAYADLGETRRAIEFYEQHRDIAREIGDRRGEGAALGNLGNAYAALGETRRAIEFYEQRLVIAREIGDRRGEGNALWNMSLALDKLGERAQAIECAAAALKIFEAIEDPNAEKVRRQLAEWRGET